MHLFLSEAKSAACSVASIQVPCASGVPKSVISLSLWPICWPERSAPPEVQQLQNLLKLTEDRIASIEKSDALARMAMGIAHDFRNILTVIQNCAELIGMTEPQPPVKRNCDLIAQAVSAALSLSRN